MTNPTPQTPEPPAAGELTAEQLLKLGCKELGWEFTESQLNRPQNIWINGNGLQLLGALRAAISADRARHPQAEQMAEPPAPAAQAVLDAARASTKDAAAWSIAWATAWLADKATARARAEALRRLRQWGGLMPSSPKLATRYSCDVVVGVCDWIDAGMTGPLPPLPDHIARREVQSNG